MTNGRTSRPHAANQEDNYRRQSVPVAGGELAVGGWGGEGPLVVAAHGITVYALDGMRPAALPVPAVFLRAPRGMLDEPDAPLNPPGRAAKWLPGVPERDVPGVNHYTITLGPAGAAAVVAAVRGG